MARPTFTPDDKQRAMLEQLTRLAAKRREIQATMTKVEKETDTVIAQAEAAKVPIDHIARHAGRTRKTVYRHLGKPMK